MTALIILLLIILGIILLLLELVVIPGITIAGIGAVLLLGASVYMAFDAYGIWGGFITAGFILLVAPVLVVKILKGKAGKRIALQTEITGTVDKINEEEIRPGDEGITIGRLAPTGKVRINRKTMEGKAITGFIDQQVAIRVVEVLKTQVIVEPIN